MKKLVLIALFIGGLTSANAVVVKNCHAYACEAIAHAETYGELSGDEATFIYNSAFSNCNG